MIRIEVLNDDKSQAAVRRDVAQKLIQSPQSAGGGPDTDDGELSAVGTIFEFDVNRSFLCSGFLRRSALAGTFPAVPYCTLFLFS